MNLDKLVDTIHKATFRDIVQTTPGINTLLSAVCPIFEDFSAATQATALGLMLGILFAEVESAGNCFDQDGTLMTREGRLRIVLAQMEVAYREAIEAASHPNCPPRKDVM